MSRDPESKKTKKPLSAKDLIMPEGRKLTPPQIQLMDILCFDFSSIDDPNKIIYLPISGFVDVSRAGSDMSKRITKCNLLDNILYIQSAMIGKNEEERRIITDFGAQMLFYLLEKGQEADEDELLKFFIFSKQLDDQGKDVHEVRGIISRSFKSKKDEAFKSYLKDQFKLLINGNYDEARVINQLILHISYNFHMENTKNQIEEGIKSQDCSTPRSIVLATKEIAQKIASKALKKNVKIGSEWDKIEEWRKVTDKEFLTKFNFSIFASRGFIMGSLLSLGAAISGSGMIYNMVVPFSGTSVAATWLLMFSTAICATGAMLMADKFYDSYKDGNVIFYGPRINTSKRYFKEIEKLQKDYVEGQNITYKIIKTIDKEGRETEILLPVFYYTEKAVRDAVPDEKKEEEIEKEQKRISEKNPVKLKRRSSASTLHEEYEDEEKKIKSKLNYEIYDGPDGRGRQYSIKGMKKKVIRISDETIKELKEDSLRIDGGKVWSKVKSILDDVREYGMTSQRTSKYFINDKETQKIRLSFVGRKYKVLMNNKEENGKTICQITTSEIVTHKEYDKSEAKKNAKTKIKSTYYEAFNPANITNIKNN